MNKFGHKTKPPECTCGSKQAGLIFIEDRYQCGDCIRQAYADLAEISKITHDEDPVQGVRSMNNLRKMQDEVLERFIKLLERFKLSSELTNKKAVKSDE